MSSLHTEVPRFNFRHNNSKNLPLVFRIISGGEFVSHIFGEWHYISNFHHVCGGAC